MKIYIVSFQLKENNETKNTYLFWKRKQWWWCGDHGRRWAAAQRTVSLRWRGSIGFFSAAFSFRASWSKASLQRHVQGLSPSIWVSQVGRWGRGVILFSVSSFNQKNKTKQNNPEPSSEVPRAWTCWLPSWARAAWQTSATPAAAAALWGQTIAHASTVTAASLWAHFRHHYCLQFFTHHVFSAHWRYQKFQIFKAVSVYVGIFIMVHGQERFSISHTQTLVHFLFLASLYFVGPTQTATLKCSMQPCHGRTPHPSRCRGWWEAAERSNW